MLEKTSLIVPSLYRILSVPHKNGFRVWPQIPYGLVSKGDHDLDGCR